MRTRSTNPIAAPTPAPVLAPVDRLSLEPAFPLDEAVAVLVVWAVSCQRIDIPCAWRTSTVSI